jgi:hypothetical protein
MEFTKRQQDLFNIMNAKLSRDTGRNLTKSEIKKLHNTIHTNFSTDEEADNALKTLSSKLLSNSETWDDWMNKNYPSEDRKKRSAKPKPKRKIVKKRKSCGCK